MGTIDLTTDFPFNPSVWIGVGKEFPDSLPLEVLDAKQKTLEIPPAKVLEGLDGAIGQIAVVQSLTLVSTMGLNGSHSGHCPYGTK